MEGFMYSLYWALSNDCDDGFPAPNAQWPTYKCRIIGIIPGL